MNPYSPPGAAPGAYPPAQTFGGGAGVSDLAIDMLRQTRPWAMLFSILCFIGSVFMLLASAGMALMGSAIPQAPNGPAFPMAALGLFYVPLAGLYIYPGIKLWAYASAIARLLASRSTADLENALGQQKSFWKFSGIAAIVVISLYFVGIVAVIAVAAVSAAGKH